MKSKGSRLVYYPRFRSLYPFRDDHALAIDYMLLSEENATYAALLDDWITKVDNKILAEVGPSTKRENKCQG